MNGNVEMLEYIYQNSEMGINTLKQLIDITQDEVFKNYLISQENEYQQINVKAKELIKLNGTEDKSINKMAQISAYLSINMQTLMDKSTSHIAEMLIRGSVMGVIEIIKDIKKYDDAQGDIIDLGRKLLQFEENNIEELKKFL